MSVHVFLRQGHDVSERYAVRKLDTGDDRFYIVDLTVPGAGLIASEAVVEVSTNYLALTARCRELNRGGS